MVYPGPARDYEPPHVAPFHNEGKTKAGWTLFWIISAGGLVAAIGFITWQFLLVFIGAAVIVAGLVVSGVMSAMGMGQPNHGKNAKPGTGEPDWYS